MSLTVDERKKLEFIKDAYNLVDSIEALKMAIRIASLITREMEEGNSVLIRKKCFFSDTTKELIIKPR